MENKRQQTTAQSYKDAKDDIANLMGWLECELAKEPKELNWANVGDLQKVRSDLIDTLEAMSGIQRKDIEESLEESRMLDNAK